MTYSLLKYRPHIYKYMYPLWLLTVPNNSVFGFFGENNDWVGGIWLFFVEQIFLSLDFFLKLLKWIVGIFLNIKSLCHFLLASKRQAFTFFIFYFFTCQTYESGRHLWYLFFSYAKHINIWGGRSHFFFLIFHMPNIWWQGSNSWFFFIFSANVIVYVMMYGSR